MSASMSESVDLSGMRKSYKNDTDAFTEESVVVKDPFMLFEEWFSLASNTDGIKEANAMAVATADKSGRPSARYVLLKEFGRKGFCFFTNYNSRKGKELAENPFASLLFYWDKLSRQVRIEGTIEKVDDSDSERYFHSRPRSSQISAILSQQSTVVENRDVLTKKQEELENKFCDPLKVIPKPDYWGGYRLIPEVFEFWQGQTNRLHDRIRFRRLNSGEVINNEKSIVAEGGWIYERLCP